MKRLKLHHGVSLDCKVLRDHWKKQNNSGSFSGYTDMKPHYDAMCFECVALIEELLGMGNDETLIGDLETWKHAGTTRAGDDILFGVKIQKYSWIRTGKYALVKDPQCGAICRFPVYNVKIKGEIYEFAAREVYNTIFCYFVRR